MKRYLVVLFAVSCGGEDFAGFVPGGQGGAANATATSTGQDGAMTSTATAGGGTTATSTGQGGAGQGGASSTATAGGAMASTGQGGATSTATAGGAGAATSTGAATTSTGACATCADLGKDCGPANDGCGNQLNCGACAVGYMCQAGVCGGCVGDTCVGGQVGCGTMLDGCGNTLDCGDYAKWSACDFTNIPAYTCQCPGLHPWGFDCAWNGPYWTLGNSQAPPLADCIVNPNLGGFGWCCTTGLLP